MLATAVAITETQGPGPVLPESLRAFVGNGVPVPGKNAIQKVNYSHDAMIDLIIANPGINQDELAASFGYTPGWVSQVIASDAFQSRLAARKNELVDPFVRKSLEDRFKRLVERSLEVLLAKLDKPTNSISDDLAISAAKVAAGALGYGARTQQVQQNNVQFVVHVPPKAVSADAWIADHAPSAEKKSPASGTGPSAMLQAPSECVVDAVVVAAPARAGTSPAEALLEQLGIKP